MATVPGDPGALLMMAVLAVLSLTLGRWLGGRDRNEGVTTALLRRAVAIFEINFGNEHPSVATALNNLAQLLK